MAETFSDYLERIFDKGLGVVDRVIDFELGEKELEIAKDISIFKAAQAADLNDPASGLMSGGTIAGFDTQTLLIVGGIGIAAIFLLRG